jgi:hypothetical protein
MTATRRLAAILAADVAGYSRLMGGLELNPRHSARGRPPPRGAFLACRERGDWRRQAQSLDSRFVLKIQASHMFKLGEGRAASCGVYCAEEALYIGGVPRIKARRQGRLSVPGRS